MVVVVGAAVHPPQRKRPHASTPPQQEERQLASVPQHPAAGEREPKKADASTLLPPPPKINKEKPPTKESKDLRCCSLPVPLHMVPGGWLASSIKSPSIGTHRSSGRLGRICRRACAESRDVRDSSARGASAAAPLDDGQRAGGRRSPVRRTRWACVDVFPGRRRGQGVGSIVSVAAEREMGGARLRKLAAVRVKESEAEGSPQRLRPHLMANGVS